MINIGGGESKRLEVAGSAHESARVSLELVRGEPLIKPIGNLLLQQAFLCNDVQKVAPPNLAPKSLQHFNYPALTSKTNANLLFYSNTPQAEY